MYLCKTMTSDSLDVIGQLLGGRDHSTIIHGIKKVTKDYEENDSTRTLIETIKKRLIQISFYLFIYVLILHVNNLVITLLLFPHEHVNDRLKESE